MSEDVLLQACIESCLAMGRAYRSLVRRNVEAVCRSYQIEDKATVERMIEETQKLLDSQRP